MLKDVTYRLKPKDSNKPKEKVAHTLLVYPAFILSLIPYFSLLMTMNLSIETGEYIIAFVGYFWVSAVLMIPAIVAVIIRRRLSKRYRNLSIATIVLNSLSILIVVLEYYF